ncbi:hypothetical protein E4T38_00577 [Aureobasidium subglaciale]|nr:hypothetical protein E4T38_00577 [Aureobasidium subglaciale]KAI5231577.1 hypothetical protein E4T40_00326 [Aureobasidium subglaciale]KAI5234285.1 hypothetical protein E4T41_00576 [Aureobasidium subglaciale]KAI5267936.1 hypothetical protein E4T46_00576 [Aureobasidium subglaciale]
MSSPGISSAAFPAALYIATVVLYSCLIVPTFYIWRRHGRAGFLAYNFVFSFCAIRIAGGALSMVARHKPNIETSATVVNSLAISPLLLAELGVLHEARNACLVRLKPRVERTLVGGFHSIITTAIILVVIGIVNVVKGLSTTQDSGLIKAGLAMFVVSYLSLLAWTTISLRNPARPRNDTFIDGTVIARLFTTTIEEKPSPSPEDRPSPIETPVLPPTVFYFSEWYPGQFQVFFHITIIYGPLPVNQIMSTDTGLAGYERPSGVKFAACCHI